MASGERVLGERGLNRALLARQGLLERFRGSLPKTLERIGGIQAQYAPSMYIGLWTRLEGFERDALTRALERRSVVQGTLMRQTIHLVSPRDYWPFAVATREARQRSWLRSHRDADARQVAAAAERLRQRLTQGPLGRKEVDSLLSDVGKGAIYGAGSWVDLVRVPPSGTWERRRADIFAAAEEWLGADEVDPGEALEHAVRSYLRGFGPAAEADVADYLGLGIREVRPALERLKLRRFAAEDGTELLDLPRMPLPEPDTPAPPRLLPAWDATLLVHARRTGILPEEHRPKVFNTKTPQSVSAFLVDGRVAGTWRYEKGRIRLEPFGRLDKRARAELDEEAERLAALHA